MNTSPTSNQIRAALFGVPHLTGGRTAAPSPMQRAALRAPAPAVGPVNPHWWQADPASRQQSFLGNLRRQAVASLLQSRVAQAAAKAAGVPE